MERGREAWVGSRELARACVWLRRVGGGGGGAEEATTRLGANDRAAGRAKLLCVAELWSVDTPLDATGNKVSLAWTCELEDNEI